MPAMYLTEWYAMFLTRQKDKDILFTYVDMNK